jgi:hypothetical protein
MVLTTHESSCLSTLKGFTNMIRTLVVASLQLAICVTAASGNFPEFTTKTLDPEIGKVCYAVTVADVNDDGKMDIVAVTENRVLWYENPTWKSHTMIEDATVADNVCIAPADIDGDGKVDFALGAGWTKEGTIQWLSRSKTLDQPWDVHFIAREPWTHRMRFANVLANEDGKPQLVVSPLNKTVGNGVRLIAFEIPENPTKDRWKPTVLNEQLNKMHNHWHTDFNNNGKIDTLTASEEGVTLIERDGDGFKATRLSETAAGEIKVGKLKNGVPFFVAIEPMHGTACSVYTSPDDGKTWKQHTIEASLKRGHALWTADMDGDGSDEVVLGHSDPGTGDIKGPGVYIYNCTNKDGSEWEKHVIDDGGIATEDLIVHDFNGDGKQDIVAGGRATHNLKLYFND